MLNGHDACVPAQKRALPNWNTLGARVHRLALLAATVHLAERSGASESANEGMQDQRGSAKGARCGQ